MPKQEAIGGMAELLKCPICLALLSAACDTNCGHAFCASCILQHLKNSNRCPLCREEIVSAHPSFVLRTLVESFRNARSITAREGDPLCPSQAAGCHGPGHAKDGAGRECSATSSGTLGCGSRSDAGRALPPGLGSTLRHSASMSSISSLSSADEERYDALLREHSVVSQAYGRGRPSSESSLLLQANGEELSVDGSRAGRAGRWVFAHKPVLLVIACVAIFFLIALVIVLMQWEDDCPLFYPALALSCSGLAWTGSLLAYTMSTTWMGRGTRFQVRVKQEAALFVVFSCFTAFAVFVSLPLPYCLLFEDCVTTCNGSLRYLLEFTTILSWLLCVEILALLLPWIWMAWAVFGSFRLLVTFVSCKPDFCSGFYETNFRDWPSMGIATLEAVRDGV